MAYIDKTNITSWPHTPGSGGTVAAGTVSPKVGWLGNLEYLKELINHLLGANRTTGHTHSGVDGDGPKIPAASIVTGTNGQVLTSDGTTTAWGTPTVYMANPMTTAGDVIKGGTLGAPARLAIGTSGQVLTVAAGAPAWATPTTYMSNPMNAVGDVIVGGSSGTPARLAVGASGTVLTSSGTTAAWTALPADPDKVYRISHTWAIPGTINVPSGDTDYIVPFFVSLSTGQTATIAKVRYRINSGTSVTCKLQKNGVDVTGYTAVSVTTTTAETDAADVALADNDTLALVVTAATGTPKNMTLSLFIEYTQ